MDNTELTFESIYESYSTNLKNYLARITGSQEADDLLQDVFVKINRDLKNFKGLSSVKTWVYKIATHTAYDRLRTLSSKKQKNCINPLLIGENMVISDFHQHNNSEHCDSKIIRKQMTSCVLDVIETIEEPYRTVIVLKDLEDFKNREIAQILQISLENVKIRLHRARKKLKMKLECKCNFFYDERNIFVCQPK